MRLTRDQPIRASSPVRLAALCQVGALAEVRDGL